MQLDRFTQKAQEAVLSAQQLAEPPERLGRDPVVRLDECAQQVLGVEHGRVHPLGELLGGEDGLLGLLGEAIELHLRTLWYGDRAGRRGRGTSWRRPGLPT